MNSSQTTYSHKAHPVNTIDGEKSKMGGVLILGSVLAGFAGAIALPVIGLVELISHL